MLVRHRRDMDDGIVQEFARGRTNGAATQELDDLLYQTGATVRDHSWPRGYDACRHAVLHGKPATCPPARVYPTDAVWCTAC